MIMNVKFNYVAFTLTVRSIKSAIFNEEYYVTLYNIKGVHVYYISILISVVK